MKSKGGLKDSMAKVELKNLTKKYGDVVAVQNMNLTIMGRKNRWKSFYLIKEKSL